VSRGQILSTAERSVRGVLRRVGVDIHRYPAGDGIARAIALMKSAGVDLVLDVGASDGGYARDLRERGYQGRLISFEPLAEPYQRLAATAEKFPAWTTVNSAVGSRNGTVTLNVAGNNGESSSTLPMLQRHIDGDPSTSYVGTEQCQILRLDRYLPEVMAEDLAPFFLKIDVQGSEGDVLEGCEGLVNEGLLAGLQVELSFAPLYEGATSWRSVFDFAEQARMELVFLRPGFSDKANYLLQADAFFFRRGSKSESRG
jgi:FkbM family methyltransferase